jgi:SAM-dependent methyltransferase
MTMGLAHVYGRLYGLCCGLHPNQNILHDEWLALKDVHADVRRSGLQLRGCTLDVGCGRKPYAPWFPHVTQYLGLDIGENALADRLISEGQAWPFADGAFDCVVSFQAFEHIKDIALTLHEVDRVLKPGGLLCLTMPFTAYEHAAPSDYRRLSQHGVRQLFPDYEILEVSPQGGIGSTAGTLLLRFIRTSMLRTKAARLVWGALLPAWLALTATVNVAGWALDRLDRTGAFYHNVLLLARKPG